MSWLQKKSFRTFPKRFKKQLTFYVPENERRKAWAFLNKNFRDESGNPKYFDYLSVQEGNGEVTVKVYKGQEYSEYTLLTLWPDWDFDSVRGRVWQTYKKIRAEEGFYGYP